MYYHGIKNGLIKDKILRIFELKEIRSAKKMGLNKQLGFNTSDYISICKNLGEEVYKEYPNNAYNKYIINHFCFIIDDDINAQKTTYLENLNQMSSLELYNLKFQNKENRYSDLIDEYQVKDAIPFEKIIGIGIPYNLPVVDGYVKLSNFCYLTEEEFKLFVNEVERLAKELNLIILDSTSIDFKYAFNNPNKNL